MAGQDAYEALRGQKTARTAGFHSHDELVEPGVLGRAVTVRYVAARVPTLAGHRLTSDDASTAAQSASLLKQSLAEKKKEWEEERRRLVLESVEQVRAKVDAENAARHAASSSTSWALVVDSGSGLFLVLLVIFLLCAVFPSFVDWLRCLASWPIWTRKTVAVVCTGLVLLVTMLPALCSLLRLAGPESGGAQKICFSVRRRHMFPYSALWFDNSGCMSTSVFDRPGPELLKTAASPQLHFIAGRRHLFVLRKLIPKVQSIQQIIEIPRSPFVFVVVVPVVWAVQSLRCCRGEDISCISLRNCRPLYPTTGALWFRPQKTAEFPQLQFMMVVDIPFVLQTQILMVQIIQQTTEFPQLQYFPGVDVPVGRLCRFFVAVCVQTVEARRFLSQITVAGFAREFVSRAVFLMLSGPRCAGRYGPEGLFTGSGMCKLVFAFGVCCTSWFDSGYMFGISLRGFLEEFLRFRT